MAGPFGSDPFGAFMAARQPATPQPSVLDDLRGTEVDPDPFGSFFAHRARVGDPEQFNTRTRRAIDYFMEGTPVQDYIGDPVESALNDRGYGRTAAAVEGVARQLTPVNVAMMGTSIARGAMKAPELLSAGGEMVAAGPSAARSMAMQELARHSDVALGGIQLGEGAAATTDAVQRGDTREALLSGGMTALGAVGAAAGMRPTRGRVIGEVLPPEAPTARPGVTLPDIDMAARGGDPFEAFLDGRQEPRALYPPGLPPGPDLPPNVGPGKPATASSAPGVPAAAPEPVVLSDRPTAQTAPAEDPAVMAARKQLRKEGYPDPLIDTILEKLVNGESADRFPRVEPGPRQSSPIPAEFQPVEGMAYAGPERRSAPRQNGSPDDALYARMREKLARGETTGSESARADFQRKMEVERAREQAAQDRGEEPLPRTAAEGVDSRDGALEGLVAPDRAPERGLPAEGGLEPARGDANRALGGGTQARPRPGADQLIDELLADAKQTGYAGSDDDLRSLLNDRVRSAGEYLDDLDQIRNESGPDALMREIRKLGGLRPFEKDFVPGAKTQKLRGEFASMVEGFKSNMGQAGASSIFRNKGLAWDDLVDQLRQNPNFRDMDQGALEERLMRLAYGVKEQGYELPQLEQALRGTGVERGKPWYRSPDGALEDILDTGEAQPRLPGAGQVRDTEIATPREDAPFSLDREPATRPGAQPGLSDMESAVGLQTSPESRIADLPDGGQPGYARVPFKVADEATLARLPQQVDYSRPQIERVPLEQLIATQPTITRDVATQKLARGPREITDLPAGSNTRPPADLPTVFKGPDGKLYLAGGTHEATAAWARGDADLQVVTYPSKAQGSGLIAQGSEIQPRHDIKNPEKVAALAQSMRENGWQGRPALVVEKDGVQVGWTATHRLEAAKQAGIEPRTLRVDGAALERAGYNLDDLSGMGKKARIEALEKAGLTEAASLLRDEMQGSPARMNPPAGAANVERVPRNVRDFLVRQLGWTDEDLARMSPAEIYRLGRERTKNPDAPARAPRPEPIRTRPEGESYDASKLTDIDSELETFLERDVPQRQARAAQRREDLIAKQGIPADRVNQPDTRQLPAPITKRDAIATRTAARSNQAQLEQDIEGRVARSDETKSERQSRVAMIQGQQRAAAKEMASAFQRGDYKRFADVVGEAADRFWNRQRKMGTGEPGVRRNESGDILEGGILPGFSMLGKVARDPAKYAKIAAEMLGNPAVRAIVGAVAGYASGDTTEESLNRALQGAALAALAPGGLRALKKAFILARDGHAPLPYKDPKSTDISMWRLVYAPSPERTIPELFTEAQGMMDRLQEIYATKGISTEQKIKAESFTKRELAHFFEDASEEAKAAGLKRKSWYAGAIARRLAGKPTAGEKVIAGFVDPIFGKGEDGRSNFDVRAIERHGRTITYRTLVGYGLDTAAQNLAQPILSLLHVSPGNLRQGYAAARTDAGRKITKGLELLKPTDVHEDILSEARQLAGKGAGEKAARPGSLKDIITDPGKALRASDNYNRRVVYLSVLQREGVLRQALRTGEVPPEADKIARSVVRRTQGSQGPLGNNPFHRGPVAGNASSFQKYPGLFLENVLDAFNDPKTRGRAFVASMLGLVAAGQLMGISTEDLLVSGGRPLGIDVMHPMDTLRRGVRVLPAGRALADVADHVTGKASHPLAAAPGEGFLDSDLAQLVMGRYPVKATKAIAETMREGLGPHKPDSVRDTRPAHTGLEDLGSLVGIKSTRAVQARDDAADAARFQREAEQRRDGDRRAGYEELDRATKSGDAAAIAAARRKLTPSQLRSYDRAQRQTPYERRRARVPAADRQEFDRKFKDRLDRQ